MNEIKAYKSITGMISEDKNVVKEDERIYFLKHAISVIVEKNCWSGMTKSDIESFLFDQRLELKKVLSQ